jgi:myo-inositol-1-phosphate synthase
MAKKEIRIAIAGIGNCCSSLIQGLFYYKNIASNNELVPGLMHNVLGGYAISSIKPVAAFDIDARKVGKDLSEAIFQKPNNTLVFQKDVPNIGVEVQMGPVMDGMAGHMEDYPEDEAFRTSKEKPVDVTKALKESSAEILVNYLPVGSEEAVKYYAKCALDAGIAFVNCMPVFIASNDEWVKRFEEKKIPVVGDDVKAQVGATITHRVLTKLWADRGVKLDRTYQLNTGGNTDFLNMLERARLKSKKISKTDAVQSQLPQPLHPNNVHIGPSDYVPWQNDNKVCFIRMEGRKFGNAPVTLELRLSVEDSPNSGGVAIDAIRCAKLGLDRGIGGNLISISAYTMKHPKIQYPDTVARQMVEEFIKGEALLTQDSILFCLALSFVLRAPKAL